MGPNAAGFASLHCVTMARQQLWSLPARLQRQMEASFLRFRTVWLMFDNLPFVV